MQPAMFLFQVVHLLVKLVQKLVSQQRIIGEVELSSRVMVTGVVARSGEV